MITCPKCGGLNPDTSKICGACGTSLTESTQEEVKPVTEANDMRYIKEDVQVEPSEVKYIENDEDLEEYQGEAIYNPNPEENQEVNEEPNTSDLNNIQYDRQVLVNYYVGNNIDKLRSGGFSWATFFMGIFYVWYRKMYKLLAIWIGISIGIGIIFAFVKVPHGSSIASFILTIVMCAKFKKLYMEHAYQEVDKLKEENRGKSQEELNEICAKKGKPTIIPVILYVLIIIAIVGTLVLIAIPIISAIIGFKINVPSVPVLNPTINYLNSARNNTFAGDALRAVEAVRNSVTTYGINKYNLEGTCTDYMCTYDKDQINNLVESKFTNSPYGGTYEQVMIQVTKDINGEQTYRVCMIDSNKNGFSYTVSTEVNTNMIKKGTAGPNC